MSTFLLVIAILAGTALSLIYYYGTENLSGKLKASSTELAKIESDKSSALAKVEDLNESMEMKLKPYRDENIRLQKRLDEVTARNDELRSRLDETLSRNAILLQRFTEQTTIDEVASVEPVSPENKKN